LGEGWCDDAQAVWWNGGDKSLPVGKFDLAFAPSVNEFNGRSAVH